MMTGTDQSDERPTIVTSGPCLACEDTKRQLQECRLQKAQIEAQLNQMRRGLAPDSRTFWERIKSVPREYSKTCYQMLLLSVLIFCLLHTPKVGIFIKDQLVLVGATVGYQYAGSRRQRTNHHDYRKLFQKQIKIMNQLQQQMQALQHKTEQKINNMQEDFKNIRESNRLQLEAAHQKMRNTRQNYHQQSKSIQELQNSLRKILTHQEHHAAIIQKLGHSSFPTAWAAVNASSFILNHPSIQGKFSTNFLEEAFSSSKKATRCFATRDHLPKTNVAAEFHKACDNVPNVLVIIKSGQYIAGGFSPASFESPAAPLFKRDPSRRTFLFSLNRQKQYRLKNRDFAVRLDKDYGPYFGNYGLTLLGDYGQPRRGGWEVLVHKRSDFYSYGAVEGELFGDEHFAVDEYEVYKLE